MNDTSPANLVSLLRLRSEESPEGLAYVFLANGEAESAHLTYLDLYREACAIGTWLHSRRAQGERALLLYPPGLSFVSAFFGCLHGGAIGVPTLPFRPHRSQPRLRAIVEDARPRFVLTCAAVYAKLPTILEQVPELQGLEWLVTDELASEPADAWREPAVSPESIAFLQYTSGSTAAPKGVMVSHGNLLHNQRLIEQACGHSARSTFVSWLPVYHDMGLIGNVIQSLYVGARCVLMAPSAFLQKPVRWLQAISRYGGTTSGAPNFAYELCVERITGELKAGLDLHSWEIAFNGAEPIRHATLERFSNSFAECGFRHESFFPCYGLAETTLIVSGCGAARPPVSRGFASSALEVNRVAADASPEAQMLVGSGTVLGDQTVRIVSPETGRTCAAGEVGEIWVSGPSVTHGYWGRPRETQETFRAMTAERAEGPFLRTGDLGFLDAGELFVTGRIKDLVIIRGRNHYPQDIELTAQGSHPSVRGGSGAAFSVDVNGEEKLILVQELDRRSEFDLPQAADAIRKAVADEHEVEIHEVLLVRLGTIAKTSSGKVQRRACRARYLAGDLPVLERSVAPEPSLAAAEPGAVRAALGAADPAARPLLLESYLREEIARQCRLPVHEIAADRPLTSLGLDSLRVSEMKQRLETGLGLDLPLLDFFEAPDLAALAAGVLQHYEAQPPGSRVALEPTGDEIGDHLLSYGQKALWFLDRLAPESAAYNLVACGLWSDLDPALLRQALATLVARHPALRTTFAVVGGEPVQRVHAEGEVDLREENASAWDPELLESRMRAEAFRPFDLAHGPLLRASVFLRSPRERIVVLAVHHIVSDLWSLSILLHELGEIYGRSGAGLPPLRLRFSDHVRWQQDLLAGAEGERLWAYWRRQLAGELPASALPTDGRRRPRIQTYHGASRTIVLGPELTARIDSLSHTRRVTRYMTLYAGFAALLRRHTGQEDILVGSPTTGRSAGELSGLIGYFVNPVVLRADLSADLPFGDFLAQARRTVLDAFEHQGYPFALLVERLQPVRDPGRSPLFQIMFSLQSLQGNGQQEISAFALGEAGVRLRIGELAVESLRLEEGRAPVDLTLMMAERDGELRAALHYNRDLFDAATIGRLLGHFQILLEGLCADPGQPISVLPLLSVEERRQLLADATFAAAGELEDTCLPQAFARQVERHGGSVAVLCGEVRWSYAELDARSNRLAHRLRREGVRPETLVGICLDRSPEVLVALLGILKAGGAYLPLDPTYPRERLALMLSDSGSSLVLTRREWADLLVAAEVRLLCLDEEAESLANESDLAPAPWALPENLAYVIYTSGSTGRPKGVQITHLSLLNLLTHMRGALGVTAGDTFLSLTTLSFDIAGLELFVPLISGARVAVVPREATLDGIKLAQELERAGATLMQATPATWRLLLGTGWPGDPELTALCGGEALPLDLARALEARTAVLWNVYGPTETTIWSSAHRVAPGEDVVSIGRPIAGTQLYVLDPHLGLVPWGVVGELHIGGVGLARGYRHRPDLTAQAFVPDPWSGEPGARLYRTGDLARYLPGGSLEVLGRKDAQVKVRGFRIELGEIEAALAQHPAVAQAVALAQRDRFGDQVLTAYAVLRPGTSADSGALRGFLKSSLPEHAVPSSFLFLDSLPLTPSGKVDRLQLAAMERGMAGRNAGFVAPRGPVEEVLAAIWSELLEVERIGADESFFELGGHSLLANRALSRIREAFQVELPLSSVFEAPTVAQLAEQVAATRWSLPAIPLSPVSREGGLPLSFAQLRLWFLYHLSPGSPAYNIPVALDFDGPLDERALAASCAEVIRRHESLRTILRRDEGGPVQLFAEPGPVSLPVADLRGEADGARELLAERLTHEEARRPFVLGDEPLIRLRLLRLEDQRYRLIAVLHHIVADGWSVDVLVRDLAAAYAAFAAGERSPLSALPLQSADFGVWQRRRLQDGAIEPQRAYWRRQLAGAPPALELAGDRPRPPVQTFAGALEPVCLPAGLSTALARASRQHGATLFMLLLAGFKALLYRYTGQEDLLVGTPLANRNRVELEELIGLLVNTVVLRSRIAEDAEFASLLAQVRQSTLESFGNQDLPFESLVDELGRARDLSRNPLFQVMFVFDHTAPVPQPPGLSLRSRPLGTATSKLDLTLFLKEGPQGLEGALEYSTDLFDAATMGRLAGHFSTLLGEIAAPSRQRVSDLCLLSADERRQLLVEWNDTHPGLATDLCLHDLVAAQAERTPEAIAVAFEGEELTYRELSRRASQLARHLNELGVGVESVVGVCMERSTEMVIGLLGILEAGGGYLPLDPDYPQERLAFMQRDAGARVVLTQDRLAERLASWDAELVRLDTGWAGRVELPPDERRPPRRARPDNLAYVIYTSGSTGVPKGVMISHRGICNRLLWMQDTFRLTPADRVLQKTPATFDVSVWEFFWPLMTGARLVVARPRGHQDSSYLVRLIAEQAITTAHFVPSMLQIFLGERDLDRCGSLARVICSGEALPVKLQERFFALLGAELYNLYGPTEASVDVTSWRCTAEPGQRQVPIGRPIAGMRTHVLDSWMQPVPVGVPGQLHLGGVGLARAYLQRPGLTADRFRPDPLSTVPGERLYQTGDLARYLPDGSIEFLGRIDHQAKLHGFRIELGEIESVLGQHPAIRETVAMVREDAPGDQHLVAYLVAGPAAPPSISELRELLLRKLPDFMVPAQFVFLESFPLSTSGKVDRKLLPAPQQARPRLGESFAAPRTPTEEVLAAVWSQVLGIDEVGIHDNFFELGGDSIRSLQVRALALQMGLDVSIQQLFAHRTIAELAREVHAADAQSRMAPTEPFGLVAAEDRANLPAGLVDAFPLAMLQSGLVFHSEYSPDYEVYITSFRLRTVFDRAALEAALRRLAERHPMLRTSFDLTSFSEPLQLVHAEAVIPLRVEDLRHLAPAEQEEHLARWAVDERKNKFIWERAPFARLHIHRLSPDTFHCALSHPIFDGWSMALMTTELFQDYLALQRPESPAVRPSPTVSYRDFVRLEQMARSSAECQAYWEQRLSGGSHTPLPLGCGRLTPGSALHVRKMIDVPQEDLRRIQGLVRSLAVPLKSALLAAHMRVISLLAGQADVTTGLIANGRPEEADAHQVLGLFLNTLPFRSRLTGGTWADLVGETFEAEREMLPFRRYPLAELQRRFSGQPAFETVFNFTHFHVYQGLQSVGGLEVLDASAPSDQTYFPLTAYFNLDLSSSRLQLAIDYDTRVLEPTQIDRIIGYYLGTLRALSQQPAAHYDASPLLSAAELAEVLAMRQETAVDLTRFGSVQELFEMQVARTPDAIAAVYSGERCTYRELNQRANRLARHLRELGAGPEARIGICLQRSLDLLVSILGILKAGAAYLPLDPAYPKDRLAWIQEDAKARLLITERALPRVLPAHGALEIFLDDERERERIGAQESGDLKPLNEPGSAAYVIYTSGSTGRPKGVVVPHRAVVSFLLSTAREPGLAATDVILAVTSLSFDIAVLELLLPLTVGACVVLVGSEVSTDGMRLAEALVRVDPTVLQATPATWRLLLEAGWPGSPRLRALCGGEALPRDLAAELQARTAAVWNLYGPTETTVWSSVQRVDSVQGPIPLGRPVANTGFYLVDFHGQLAAAGVASEIHLGGAGVTRGYANRPDLTAEKFVPDAFSGEPGARLYRTGDLARRLPDGAIEFLGRIDHQVKIRGFRIELGEIEAVLASHPAIHQAVVVAREDHPGDQRLVAYVVAVREAAPPSSGELRAFLKKTLPEYMLPAAFVALEVLPFTANRKIDRRALPVPGETEVEAARVVVAPRDALELQLVDLWRSVLTVPALGVTDDFFELGGHSLLALRLMARIRKQLGRELSVAALFKAPTVEKLAMLLRQRATPAGSGSPLVAIQPLGSRPPLFCVHPVGGNVLCYADLARQIGTDLPFYGLQSPDLDAGPPLLSIEEMAAHYLEALRSVQPQGPYQLAGWSMGAVVAFEMAQQLVQRGESVESLTLIDASCPGSSTRIEDGEERALAAWFAQDLAGRFGKTFLLPAETHDGEADDILSDLLEQAREAGLLPADAEMTEIRFLFDLFGRNLRAMRSYEPEPYSGPILLFRAARRRPEQWQDPSMGWSGVASGGLEIRELQGDHYSLLRMPQVSALAEQLRDYLVRDTTSAGLLAAQSSGGSRDFDKPTSED